MKKEIICISIFVLIEFIPLPIYAENCAVSEIEGNVCTGFVIESCKFVRIDAVKDDDGKYYEIRQCYESVTDHDDSSDRCWIQTKSKRGGLISWGINVATQPAFLHLDEDGQYEELDVEYLVFDCVKR